MKISIFGLAALAASMTWAQDATQGPVSEYAGPGVLSRGAGSIGQRAGQDVDLRFYANAMGIYDTGLTPISSDGTGIVNSGGLYGVEVGIGAYGRHDFRRGVLGLDYQGTYRHYTQNTFFNGTNQQLTLGYTWQKSRRLSFGFRQTAGSSAYATALAAGLPGAGGQFVDATTLLFDNRTNYLQSSVDMTYLGSQRTSYTIGGNWHGIFRQSKALVGVRGYGLRGSIEHRFSPRTSGSVNYDHTHYEFPGSFGGSDIDTFSGSFSRLIGRSWKASISAGVYHAKVEGLTQVELDPIIAFLLGVPRLTVPFYTENIVPYGQADLEKKFRSSVLNFSYQRFVTPGNGVYLTSRQQSGQMSYSYSGIRRWSFWMSLGYWSLTPLGSGQSPYAMYNGSVSANFTITDSFHIGAGFTGRHQEVEVTNFRRNNTRTFISLSYSPGSIPISFR